MRRTASTRLGARRISRSASARPNIRPEAIRQRRSSSEYYADEHGTIASFTAIIAVPGARAPSHSNRHFLVRRDGIRRDAAQTHGCDNRATVAKATSAW
jgi:hypothetical protein